MRLLHTADWHLGQVLHGIGRAYEHARFFAWLERTLLEEEVDALVVAGDVFDVANPSPAAQSAYYRLLARLRVSAPRLNVVIVGGNHDSPDRLDAPSGLLRLEPLSMAVVGGLPRRPDGTLDHERAIVPLRDRDGRVAAHLLAVPFLRRSDVLRHDPGLVAPLSEEAGSEARFFEGHRALYRELTQAAAGLRGDAATPIVATGHCYMAGGEISELSERKIQVGNQQALPLDIFPEALAYVALGHLHRAQSVLGRETVRYSGSPIPLSMAEREYTHQVVLIDFEGRGVREIQRRLVPRAVEMLSIPETHRPIGEVLAALQALPSEGPSGADEAERPLLEVKIELESAAPRVRQDVEAALSGKFVRLVRIDVRYRTPDARPPGTIEGRGLDAISPAKVFEACYQRQRSGPVPHALEAAFLELVEEAEREVGA